MTALTRRAALVGTGAMTAVAPLRARSQTPLLRIGVLTNMSGPYQDAAGPLSVLATQQVVAEAAGGMAVEVVSADHQNKADIATAIPHAWFDRDGVDLSVDGTNSACGLAIAAIAKEKSKVHINNGAATSGDDRRAV